MVRIGRRIDLIVVLRLDRCPFARVVDEASTLDLSSLIGSLRAQLAAVKLPPLRRRHSTRWRSGLVGRQLEPTS